MCSSGGRLEEESAVACPGRVISRVKASSDAAPIDSCMRALVFMATSAYRHEHSNVLQVRTGPNLSAQLQGIGHVPNEREPGCQRTPGGELEGHTTAAVQLPQDHCRGII